jgi:hypothetical protein
MTLDRTARRKVAPITPSTFVAVLALVVMLIGIFAIHSEATGHDMRTSVVMSSAAAGPLDATIDTAVLAIVPVLMSSGAHDGSLNCALLALACVLLLTLVALIGLTHRPAVYRRLLDAGGVVLGLLRTIALSIYRPSLTRLSISRV